MGNYTPQFDELQHPKYPQFDNQASHPSSCNYLPQDPSLEDTLKAFIQSNNKVIQELQQSIQEIKDANTQAITGLKDWIC